MNIQATTAQRVQTMIAEQLHIEVATVVPSATLTSLGADSLDVVELIMRFEEEFDIEIDDAAVENLHSVGDVIAYIDTARAKRNSDA